MLDGANLRFYASDPTTAAVAGPPPLHQSRHSTKIVMRHPWAVYLEEADHLRHTTCNKALYALRSRTIERVFADCKEKHGMRYAHYRGLKKVTDEAWLTFACMNMKKMANRSWRQGA